jgi:ribosomal protein L11
VPLRAHIYIYTDKTFELTINIPTLYYFLKSSLSLEEIDLIKFKRKPGYIDLRTIYLPIFNKNMVYTILKYVTDNLIFVINLKSLFKKILGIIYSSGFFFFA